MSSCDGSSAGSVDVSLDGLMDGSIAGLFFWSGDFSFLMSSASIRELSSFLPDR